MNNFISFNAKYYKDSNASGEIGHVQRVFAENTNQIRQFAKDNFGCGYSIYDRYKEIYKQVEEVKGKKIQSNSNTFMDGVLSFSRDQMFELMKEPNWKESFSEHIEQYMKDVQEKTGLEPLGWEMHMDEGHKDPETGEFKMNYHAQLIFFNYDFKTNKAPLRDLMGRKGDSIWSKLQDLAGQVFQPLGFVRGVSKDMTHQKHVEKDVFIAQKQAELNRQQAHIDNALKENQELLERAALITDEILDEANQAIEVINAREIKKKAEIELRDRIEKNVNGLKRIVEEHPIVSSLAGTFKSKFPEFTEVVIKTYKQLLEFFRIDDSGDPQNVLKNTKSKIAEARVLNDEIKRRSLRKAKI